MPESIINKTTDPEENCRHQLTPEEIEHAQSIISGLVDGDEKTRDKTARDFFWGECKSLLNHIIGNIFDWNINVSYDECVSMLYLHLMENDAHNLRTYDYRSKLTTWLKTTAIRFFIKNKDKVLGIEKKSSLYDIEEDDETDIDDQEEHNQMFVATKATTTDAEAYGDPDQDDDHDAAVEESHVEMDLINLLDLILPRYADCFSLYYWGITFEEKKAEIASRQKDDGNDTSPTIEELTVEQIAERMDITVDNLYNIKRRARIALQEVYRKYYK